MQSTNSEYGSPYLATRHVTSLSLNNFMSSCALYFFALPTEERGGVSGVSM